MEHSAVLDIAIQGLILAAKLAGPCLLTALAVGFLISLFQSMTQIQEVTLSFVPKAIAVVIVLAFTTNWMIQEITTFTYTLHENIPAYLQGG